METGATFGFYSPTNQENVTGGVCHIVFIGNKIKCNYLILKWMKNVTMSPAPPHVRDNGHQSSMVIMIISDILLARPRNFFDLQLLPFSITFITDVTNLYTTANSVGSEMGHYKDLVSFNRAKLDKFAGICLPTDWPQCRGLNIGLGHQAIILCSGEPSCCKDDGDKDPTDWLGDSWFAVMEPFLVVLYDGQFLGEPQGHTEGRSTMEGVDTH